MYEATICEDCGQPRDRSMNPEMAGRYQIHTHTCYASQALETAREQQRGEKGVKNYVVDAGPAELTPYPITLAPIDEDVYDEATADYDSGERVKNEDVGL